MHPHLILIGHGHAHSNAAGVAGGPNGCAGLTDLGTWQARQLAAHLAQQTSPGQAPPAVYASSSRRARQTADIVAAALDVAVTEVPDLRDPDFGDGDGDGRPWEEILSGFPGDPSARLDEPLLPGAEPWPAYLQRTWAALDAIVGAALPAVVVGHAETVKAAFHRFLGGPPNQRLPIKVMVDDTAVTRWQLMPPRVEGCLPRWMLLTHNDTAHLAERAPMMR